MGAWGVGHFDNDDACDWVWELEDTGTASPVTAAFAAVEAGANYLEAPDACIALAAAEVVAAWAGNPAAETPDTVIDLVEGFSEPLDPALLARARAAVERVATDSELRELWAETEDFAAWRATVDGLLRRLQAA